jgi:hypothetical protein
MWNVARKSKQRSTSSTTISASSLIRGNSPVLKVHDPTLDSYRYGHGLGFDDRVVSFSARNGGFHHHRPQFQWRSLTEYLRPVNWILSSGSGKDSIVVVISPHMKQIRYFPHPQEQESQTTSFTRHESRHPCAPSLTSRSIPSQTHWIYHGYGTYP